LGPSCSFARGFEVAGGALNFRFDGALPDGVFGLSGLGGLIRVSGFLVFLLDGRVGFFLKPFDLPILKRFANTGDDGAGKVNRGNQDEDRERRGNSERSHRVPPHRFEGAISKVV
jgi:hypothetical protein